MVAPVSTSFIQYIHHPSSALLHLFSSSVQAMSALPVYLYPLDSSAWIVPLTYSFPILSIVLTSSFCQCHVSKSYITACLTVLWTLIFIIAAVLLSQITLDTCAATPSCLYCNFTSLLDFLALYGSLHVLKLIYYH